MNPPKSNESDHINFLNATQKAYSCTEAERVQPISDPSSAHDTITRLLHRLEPSTTTLWQEAQQQVDLESVILVVDDSRLIRLKRNYHVNPDTTGNRPLFQADIASTRTVAHIPLGPSITSKAQQF